MHSEGTTYYLRNACKASPTMQSRMNNTIKNQINEQTDTSSKHTVPMNRHILKEAKGAEHKKMAKHSTRETGSNLASRSSCLVLPSPKTKNDGFEATK